MAVHGGAGLGLGAAGTLIAAHLISGHGFLAADAIAWVRLVHPAALPSAHQRFLRDSEDRALRRRLSSLSSANLLSDDSDPHGGGGGTGVDERGWGGSFSGRGLVRSVSAPRVLGGLGDDNDDADG